MVNDDGERMRLRDYFAGQAMMGLVKEIAENLAADIEDDPLRADKAMINGAALCYSIADAMLKARASG